MPLYEFQCDECGHRFEIIQQKFSDPPPAGCPRCGGAVRKLVSSPAFQFKGSGWYVTDYAKKPESPKSTGGSTTESKEGSAKDSKASTDTSSKDAGTKDTSATGSPSAPTTTTPTTKSS